MAESATQSVGRHTERLAELHLTSCGLTSVARNYRCRQGEIDLVMLDGGTLVFIEVRYRRPNRFARACATVDANKQRKLARAAAVYLSRHSAFRDHPVRFDVVGMDGPNFEKFELQWLKDAFRPEE